MKKPLSKKALAQEIAFWGKIKKVATHNPSKVCRK
jgi:hypothetical protein